MIYYKPERITRQTTLYDGKVSKHNKSDAPDIILLTPDFFSWAVIFNTDEIF